MLVHIAAEPEGEIQRCRLCEMALVDTGHDLTTWPFFGPGKAVSQDGFDMVEVDDHVDESLCRRPKAKR